MKNMNGKSNDSHYRNSTAIPLEKQLSKHTFHL